MDNVFNSEAVLGTNPEQIPDKEATYQIWKKAKQSYQEKEYQQSLTWVEQVQLDNVTEKEQAELKFQRALLYMLTQKYQKSYDLFQEVNYDPSRTAWYKAILLLKLKQPKNTVIDAFEKIAKSPSNRFAEDAGNILKELKKMKN